MISEGISGEGSVASPAPVLPDCGRGASSLSSCCLGSWPERDPAGLLIKGLSTKDGAEEAFRVTVTIFFSPRPPVPEIPSGKRLRVGAALDREILGLLGTGLDVDVTRRELRLTRRRPLFSSPESGVSPERT